MNLHVCDTKNKKTVTKIGQKCKTSARRYSIVELAGLKKEEIKKGGQNAIFVIVWFGMYIIAIL